MWILSRHQGCFALLSLLMSSRRTQTAPLADQEGHLLSFGNSFFACKYLLLWCCAMPHLSLVLWGKESAFFHL